ncbi:RICIN domain-containing protein [Actinoplanes sp. CA-252034]|uniref:RICIN domain-containing protein n=1 Tax=Actinoplanes sp. CA-252034 TaxID=3239906 RepID=UPI003D965A50
MRTCLRTAAVFAAAVVAVTALANPAQATRRAAPSLMASGVMIVNSVSKLCVQVADASTRRGARIQQWACGTATHRRWNHNDLGGGYVQYSNLNSNMCLAAVWGTTNVTQEPCNSTDGQQAWRWLPADAFGNQVLVNTTPWGDSCLALKPFSWVNGRVIGIADCATTSAQLWHPATD